MNTTGWPVTKLCDVCVTTQGVAMVIVTVVAAAAGDEKLEAMASVPAVPVPVGLERFSVVLTALVLDVPPATFWTSRT